MANDFGFEEVFAKPLSFFAGENDILIAISSSGNSKNILNAARVAHEKGMKLITLSGFKENNHLWCMDSDAAVLLQSDLYGIVEAGHEVILHGIIETLWLKQRGAGSENPGRICAQKN